MRLINGKSCLAGILYLLVPASVSAETLYIAVAANFNSPMNTLVSEFEAQTGHEVSVSYGSSGRLFAQITNGAPFQAFFSADRGMPEQLEARGHALAGSRFTYAIGTLVLWSPDAALFQDNEAALRNGGLDILAIANERLAPYGVAAIQTLESLGLTGLYRDRIVRGENITQAFQFVDTGNATAGFVALSQVLENGQLRKGSGWIVPSGLHDPIMQDAVVLTPGSGNPAVAGFMAFVRSDRGKAIAAAYGYGAP